MLLRGILRLFWQDRGDNGPSFNVLDVRNTRLPKGTWVSLKIQTTNGGWLTVGGKTGSPKRSREQLVKIRGWGTDLNVEVFGCIELAYENRPTRKNPVVRMFDQSSLRIQDPSWDSREKQGELKLKILELDNELDSIEKARSIFKRVRKDYARELRVLEK